MNPTSSTDFTYISVPYATVVKTECEANIFRLVRGLSNRSVGTYVYGFDQQTEKVFKDFNVRNRKRKIR